FVNRVARWRPPCLHRAVRKTKKIHRNVLINQKTNTVLCILLQSSTKRYIISPLHDGIHTGQAYKRGSGWRVSLGMWLITSNTVLMLSLKILPRMLASITHATVDLRTKNPLQRWKDVSHVRGKKRRKTTRPFHRLLGARVQQRNCEPGPGCQYQVLSSAVLPE